MQPWLEEQNESSILYIYYIFKRLPNAKIKIEKLAFAIMIAACKLRPYFQTYEITINTNCLLKTSLEAQDISEHGV